MNTNDLEAAKALLRKALPDVLKAATEMATDPKASATNQLKAVELLLRFVGGPPRPDADDLARSREARQALQRTSSLLREIAKSHKSQRLRSRAAKLVDRLDHLAR